jgi:hypothetical protein
VKDHTLDKQMFSTYLSSDNIFMLSKNLKGQLNASWYGPQMDGAYHFQSMFTLGLGLTKTILHNNGTLAFNVSDVFNSYKARYRTVSDGLLITNTDHPESRFVKLVFTWRFGNKNVKTTRARSTGIDEVKNRMGN